MYIFEYSGLQKYGYLRSENPQVQDSHRPIATAKYFSDIDLREIKPI